MNDRGTSSNGRVEFLVSNLLRIGVTTSVCIIFIGMGLAYIQHADAARTPAELEWLVNPATDFPHSLRAVVEGLRTARGESVVVLGLLVLIGTPVMRVALSIGAWVIEKDWAFVAITSFVMVLLIVSFILGHAAA